MDNRKTNSLQNYRLEGDELGIYTYPDPVLKQVATPVEVFEEDLEKLCFDMLYTMYNAQGIGLAAPQVGILKRLFVIDTDYTVYRGYKNIEEEDSVEEDYPEGGTFRPRILINPVIRNCQGETSSREGCLSVPKTFDDVTRYLSCTVDYQNLKGEKCSLDVSGLLSICIQHEIDHLNGIVFLEHLSSLKREFYIKKILKKRKETVVKKSL